MLYKYMLVEQNLAYDVNQTQHKHNLVHNNYHSHLFDSSDEFSSVEISSLKVRFVVLWHVIMLRFMSEQLPVLIG